MKNIEFIKAIFAVVGTIGLYYWNKISNMSIKNINIYIGCIFIWVVVMIGFFKLCNKKKSVIKSD